MSSPIYSNSFSKDNIDSNLEKHIISLLSDKTVSNINEKLTFVKHGIYIFIQYKESGYIINGFSEDVFWNLVNGLYRLIHDCGNETLEIFLQVVLEDGFQKTKPFNLTDEAEKQKIDNAFEFIKDIENMRIVHYHNMKKDSELNKERERRMQKKFQKILNTYSEPKSELEWEHCVNWIYNNCKNIQKLLEDRLEFIQTKATDEQRNCLCEKYYVCIQAYYKRVMFEIIKNVLKKKRKRNENSIIVQALVNENEEAISAKAIILIQNSSGRVDPYIAALQAADTILTQKFQIK